MQFTLALLLVASFCLTGVRVADAADMALRCQTYKLKAVTRHVKCRARYDALATLRDVATDPAAINRCDKRFIADWYTAEAKTDGLCPNPAHANVDVVGDATILYSKWVVSHLAGSSGAMCTWCAGDIDGCGAATDQCRADLEACTAHNAELEQDVENLEEAFTQCLVNCF